MRFKYVAKDFIRESLIYYILSDMSFYERYFYRESLFLTIGYLKIPVSTMDLSILTINGFHHMNTWIYKPLDPFTEPIERGKIVIDCRSLVMNQLKPYQHIEIMKKGEYETYYDYDNQWICISRTPNDVPWMRVQIATQIIIDLNEEGQIDRFWVLPYFVGSLSDIDKINDDLS